MIKKEKKKERDKEVLVIKKPLKYHQRIMIKYIVAGLSINDFSDKFGVSITRCKAWLKSESVIKEIESKLENHINLSAEKRKKRSEFLSTELYDVLLQKIGEGSLNKMNIRNIFRFYSDMNKEVRVDTPGDSTKKIDHRITLELSEELSQRYINSKSSPLNESNNDNKIIDITIPKPKELSPAISDEVNYGSPTEKQIVVKKSS